MNLEGIISISGKGGLFKLVGQSKAHLVVEQIGEGKRFPVYASDKVSALQDISIYTEEDDVPLADVFLKIHDKESGGKCIDHKSGANELKGYLSDVLPDYDDDRVYNSDIKKLFQWYNILQESGELEEAIKEGDGNPDFEVPDAGKVKETAKDDEAEETEDATEKVDEEKQEDTPDEVEETEEVDKE